MNNILQTLFWAIFLLLTPILSFAQAPNLGTAADFVLFSSNGAVSNVGITHLTGNVGTNNGSSTGFGNVNGVMNDGNGVSAQCAADLLIAYNQLNSTIPNFFPAPLLGNGDTLIAGVYAISGAATLNLDLILDAQGDANAVFIFQIQGSLSTGAASKVKLINGALACNVFWKVEGLVSMATNSSMKGTIIANNAAIEMSVGDTLEGRALSTTGAVTVNGILAYTPIGCGSPALTGPAAPALGSAACYTIFSSDGPVTNAGVTYVTGDVGSNNGLTTGFNPLFVTGTIHPIPDVSTAQCAADVLVAYNYTNILPHDIELLYPAQFGNNLVLTPHTYLMNGAVTFTDSLFLNARGDSNAVFVIKISGAFNTSTYSQVVLMNGAKSENVYWKIDGAVSINNYSVFRGTIIANNAGVNLGNTGIELFGRAFTTTGAVTTTAIVAIATGSSAITQNIVLCAGDSVIVGTNVYNITGIYTDTLGASNGCDSVVTTNLTMVTAITSTQNPILCAGDSVIVGTNVYNTTGNYSDTLTAAAGCDSIVTTNLTMMAAITSTQNPVLCAGDSVIVGTNVYNITGVYTDTLGASNGCDSVVTTDLTMIAAITFTQNPVLCAGNSITVGTNVYNTTGNYSDTLTAAGGCDSIVTTNLTMVTAITFTQNPVLCAGNSIMVGTNVYNTTGNYSDTLTAAGGCDSIVTTNLTMVTAITFTQNPVLCAGNSITVGTNVYNMTGNYSDTLTAAGGCDSIVTTNLTMVTAITFTQNPVLCAGNSITVGTNVYNMTGNYSDTLTAAGGCDSIVTTNLTMVTAMTFTQNPVLCAGNSIMVGTNVYNTTGNYSDTLTAAGGCDSIVTTNLTMVTAITFTQNPVLCAGNSIMVGTNVYNTTGNYSDTLTAAGGCDSIVTTNLTVNLLPPNVVMMPPNPDTMCMSMGLIYLNTGTPSGGFYTGVGVSGLIFDPVMAGAGTHTIIYTFTDADGCTNMDSANVTVDICASIADSKNHTITLYPNPTHGIVYINLEGMEIPDLRLSVYDMLGRMVLNRIVTNSTETVDLSQVVSGIYLIRIEGKELQFVQKIVKE